MTTPSDHDLEVLDDYLSSRDGAGRPLDVSRLDGFLVCAVCTPDDIPVSRCLAAMLGEPVQVPDAIVGIIGRRHDDVFASLEAGEACDPVFWQAPDGHFIATDWCEGFMDAVRIWPGMWSRFMWTDQGSRLLTPILIHMTDTSGNSMFGIPQEKVGALLDAAVAQIPTTVTEVYRAIRAMPPTC